MKFHLIDVLTVQSPKLTNDRVGTCSIRIKIRVGIIAVVNYRLGWSGQKRRTDRPADEEEEAEADEEADEEAEEEKEGCQSAMTTSTTSTRIPDVPRIWIVPEADDLFRLISLSFSFSFSLPPFLSTLFFIFFYFV